MPTLKFSEQWDKLKPDRFKEREMFTTFREYKPDKDAYYQREKGSVFYVVLDENEKGMKTWEPELLGTARLKNIGYRWSSEFTVDEIKKDTYEYWAIKDFEAFLRKQYGIDTVYGLFMTFEIVNVHMISAPKGLG